MAVMNEIKSGADLTHPKPTITYVITAAVAVAVLMVVVWLVKKAKKAIPAKMTGQTSGLEAQSTAQLEGFL